MGFFSSIFGGGDSKPAPTNGPKLTESEVARAQEICPELKAAVRQAGTGIQGLKMEEMGAGLPVGACNAPQVAQAGKGASR